MNVSAMYAAVLYGTSVTQTNYPLDANSMYHLNDIYKELMEEINKLNEQYLYKRWYIDTVPMQNKYALPIQSGATKAIKKINTVYIKYQQTDYPAFVANQDYQKGDRILHLDKTYICKVGGSFPSFSLTDWAQIYIGYQVGLDNSLNQSNTENANFFFQDVNFDVVNQDSMGWARPVYWHGQNRDLSSTTLAWNLYIYPYVTYAITEGIIIDGMATVVDLTTTSAEADIYLESDYHYVLVEGWKWKMYESQQKTEAADRQYKYYMQKRQTVLSEITDRVESPGFVITPNLDFYT